MAIHGPFSADPLSMGYRLPADTSSIERLCGEGPVRTRTDSRMTTESWEAIGSAGGACRCPRAAIGSVERAPKTRTMRNRDAATDLGMTRGMRDGV
jgi:hypothetical protein